MRFDAGDLRSFVVAQIVGKQAAFRGEVYVQSHITRTD
jgi:hypothetical protein